MINSVQMNAVNQYKPSYKPVSNENKLTQTGKNSKLSIFYINDMHGNIDNMGGLIAASDKFDMEKEAKGFDTLKLSAGDNVTGGKEEKNDLVIGLMNRIGIDASAVGNHEFDASVSSLCNILSKSKAKFLAANADAPLGSEFGKNIQKSEIIEENGTKYGIIGLLPFDLMTVTGGSDEILEGVRPKTMEDSIAAVNEEARKLTEQGIDRIILISHIGNDKDKEIVSKLHGIDVIVGGHSHTLVQNVEAGENLFNNADGDPVVILQTGENAKRVGILNVEFNEKGVPISFENNVIETNTEKTPALEHLKNAKLGKSPKVVVIDEIESEPEDKRRAPGAWTNLLADSMRSETNVDIAFVNAANSKKVPKKGTLTERDITDTTPYKNTLLVKKMTEKEVVRAIKEAVETTYNHETGEPGLLHTSGLSYVADTDGNLLELNFVDKSGNKTPININSPSDKVYDVCYDSFMAKGTEYPVFKPDTMTYKNIDRKYDYNKDKCAADYLRKQGKEHITVKNDNRIVILKDGTPVNNKTVFKKPEKKQEEAKIETPIAPTSNNLYPDNQLNIYNPYPAYYTAPLNSYAAINAYAMPYSAYTTPIMPSMFY